MKKIMLGASVNKKGIVAMIQQNVSLSTADFEKLVAKCKSLPPAKESNRSTDYVENLFLTVLDYQMKGIVVKRAIEHAKSVVSDYAGLKRLIAQYPDTKEGNLVAAQHLWGYNHWKRFGLLRQLLAFFEERKVTTQDELEKWVQDADFEQDFKGKIKGLAFTLFKWLQVRQGIETVKPDIWVHRFIEDMVGYAVSDEVAVEALERVAKELGVHAPELDIRIWEYQRSLHKKPRPTLRLRIGETEDFDYAAV